MFCWERPEDGICDVLYSRYKKGTVTIARAAFVWQPTKDEMTVEQVNRSTSVRTIVSHVTWSHMIQQPWLEAFTEEKRLLFHLQTEYFHDDLFPDCSTPPGPVTTASQWWLGGSSCVAAVSLRPAGMPLYSKWRREEEERQKNQQARFTARTEAARLELSEKQRQEKVGVIIVLS